MKKLLILLSLCGLTSMAFATSSPALDDKTTVVVTTTADCSTGSPCFVIKTSANTLSQAVNQNLSSQQAFTMVQNSIIPQIDFTLMTRLAMGNNWMSTRKNKTFHGRNYCINCVNFFFKFGNIFRV